MKSRAGKIAITYLILALLTFVGSCAYRLCSSVPDEEAPKSVRQGELIV